MGLLDISGQKLPSRRESTLLLAACVLPVYGWSIFMYFWEVPGWEKYLSAWDIANILAYVLALALMESLLLFSVLVLLRVLLPTRMVRDRFVAKATMFVGMNVLWAILLHLTILSDQILIWTVGRYVLCVAVYLLSMIFSWAFVHFSEFFAARIEDLVDRMTVFVYLYVPLGVFSTLTVIARKFL